MEIKKVTLLIRAGCEDILYLELDEPTTHPEMQYPATAKIDCRKGYGLEWCRQVFGREPDEIING